MGIHVDFHSDVNEGLTVTSDSYSTDAEGEFFRFLTTTISTKGSHVRLFITDIADVDRLAFEFETLSRSLREQYRNIGEKENKA